MNCRQVRTVVLALAVIPVCSGCARTDQAKKTQLAANGKWVVTAVGDLQPPLFPLAVNRLYFVAVRKGDVFARGPFFDVPSDDLSFQDQFPRSEWIGENTIHFWYPPKQPIRILQLTFRNQGTKPLKWVLIRSDEIFLALEPGNSIVLPLFAWGDHPWFDITGEYSDGTRLLPHELSLRRSFDRIQLTLSDGKITADGELN